MVVFETFSKRQKRLLGETPDVYTYDQLPNPLRVQVLHALHDVTGTDVLDNYGRYTPGYRLHEQIVLILRREFGFFNLPPREDWENENFITELGNYFLRDEGVSRVLDALEVICWAIERLGPKITEQSNCDEAIKEINQRLREHGIGYEYDDELVRIDSELVHIEVVKPALALLRDSRFSGAEQEFRRAFEHFRNDDTKEALTDALKAIESTLKVIFSEQGWTFDPSDPVKKLLDVAFSNGLIPPYWQSHFTALRAMLESSVPTARNKNGAHGQGVEIQKVPDYLASYVLHMTASTIVFLVKAEQALP